MAKIEVVYDSETNDRIAMLEDRVRVLEKRRAYGGTALPSPVKIGTGSMTCPPSAPGVVFINSPLTGAQP